MFTLNSFFVKKLFFFFFLLSVTNLHLWGASNAIENWKALCKNQNVTTEELQSVFNTLDADVKDDLLSDAVDAENQVAVQFLLNQNYKIQSKNINQYQVFQNKDFLAWLITQCNFQMPPLTWTILKVIVNSFDHIEAVEQIKTIVPQHDTVLAFMSTTKLIELIPYHHRNNKNDICKIMIMYGVEITDEVWKAIFQGAGYLDRTSYPNYEIAEFLVEHYDYANKEIFALFCDKSNEDEKLFTILKKILSNIPDEDKEDVLTHGLIKAIYQGNSFYVIPFIFENADIKITNQMLSLALNHKTTYLFDLLLNKELAEAPNEDVFTQLIRKNAYAQIKACIDKGGIPTPSNLYLAYGLYYFDQINHLKSSDDIDYDWQTIPLLIKAEAKPSENLLQSCLHHNDLKSFEYFMDFHQIPSENFVYFIYSLKEIPQDEKIRLLQLCLQKNSELQETVETLITCLKTSKTLEQKVEELEKVKSEKDALAISSFKFHDSTNGLPISTTTQPSSTKKAEKTTSSNPQKPKDQSKTKTEKIKIETDFSQESEEKRNQTLKSNPTQSQEKRTIDPDAVETPKSKSTDDKEQSSISSYLITPGLVGITVLTCAYDYHHFEKEKKSKKETSESSDQKEKIENKEVSKKEKKESKIKRYCKDLFKNPKEHKKIFSTLLLSILGYAGTKLL